MSAAIDLAMRVGRYIPHSAVTGGSYPSGGLSVDPERLGTPKSPGLRQPADEYIPSIPELYARDYPAPAPETAAEEPDAPAETAEERGREPENEGAPDRADEEYTPDEQRVIADLQARDREVRSHEQAHISAGGAYIRGGATYEYENGPDNKRYAVGGEVSIDSSPVRDNPEATIAKMQVVRSAALAPADPSAQDRAVAAAASREEARASSELREQKAAEQNERNGNEQRQNKAYDNAIAAYANANQFAAQPAISLVG